MALPVHGQLDTMLLAVLAERPVHGYALIEALRSRSGGAFELAEGTVYPALYRLEESGLLRSSMSVVDGRSRRVYALTRAGRPELAERWQRWQEFEAAVNAVLGRKPWPTSS